jgi:SH3 domain-containing YSC84-like protein 1
MTMKRAVLLLTAFQLIFLFILQTAVASDSSGTARLQDSLQVFSKALSKQRGGIPPALLQKASGIVVIPRFVKASFLVGAKTGKGVLMVRDASGNWSNPILVSLKGLSLGLQMGVQSSDVVMLFMKSRTLDAKSKENFILGADVSMVAGLLGLQMDENTDPELQTEIHSFSRAVGLNVGFALQGVQLLIDDAATSALYGKEGLNSRDILSGKVDQIPVEVVRFRDDFSRLAGKGQ